MLTLVRTEQKACSQAVSKTGQMWTPSPSFSNMALSSGWEKEENEALAILLMKFGLGRWTKIIK